MSRALFDVSRVRFFSRRYADADSLRFAMFTMLFADRLFRCFFAMIFRLPLRRHYFIDAFHYDGQSLFLPPRRRFRYDAITLILLLMMATLMLFSRHVVVSTIF